MAIKLFELVKGEIGAIVPKYELQDFKEFIDIIEKPVINLIGYQKHVSEKNFVKEKALECFNYLLKEYEKPDYSSEYLMELSSMKENFEKNVKKASVYFTCPKKASDLINKVKNFPCSEYLLWNIDKINEDLIEIYHQS